jgi:hypothetical protein
MNRICQDCAHWSELVWCYEEGEIGSLCEAPAGSPLFGQFSNELDFCSAWLCKPTTEG